MRLAGVLLLQALIAGVAWRGLHADATQPPPPSSRAPSSASTSSIRSRA
ncbi:MAG: hypothetical protein MZV70_10900 [Desulfobacterales bacterium]|nr:hypothetical protein [Desulfobacterales bacterium]